MEKLTRAVLSSDDGGVPLVRFASDYQRMTSTQFPWREYGFSSARDMLLSMENVVEFKFSDKEEQFYLFPARVTRNSNDGPSIQINENEQINSVVIPGRIGSRIQHSSSNQSTSADITEGDTMYMPSLVETTSSQGGDMFAFDRYGRVSVYVSQSKEKPAKGYWNVCATSCNS